MRSVTCSSCGLVCWADADNCKRCGQQLLPNPHPLNVPPPRGDEPRQNPQSQNFYASTQPPQDLYASTQPPQNFYAAPNLYSPPPTKKRTGFAVASLTFGVIGLLTFGLLLVGSIVGTILGMVALKKESSEPSVYGGKGLAIGGITLNIVGMLMIIPLALIASIAIPNLLASRRAANEASAISCLRTIGTAETTYSSTVGGGSYGTLAQLAAAQLVSSELSSGERHGYRFSVQTTARGFEATATPLTYGSTGLRSFYASEEGEIHVGLNHGLPATASDPTLDEYSYGQPSYSQRRVSQPLRGPSTIPAQ
jgi:type II secretory pathway pseudopilin PulG